MIPNRDILRSNFIKKGSESRDSRLIQIYFNRQGSFDPETVKSKLSDLTRLISQTEGVDAQKPCKVLISDLKDSNIAYKISAFCVESADVEEVKSDLYLKILETLS